MVSQEASVLSLLKSANNIQILLIPLWNYQGDFIDKVNSSSIWKRIEISKKKKSEFNQFYYSGDCAPSISKQVPVTVLSMCQIIGLPSFVILLQVHFLRKAMSLSIIIHTEINFLLTAKCCRHKFAFAVW